MKYYTLQMILICLVLWPVRCIPLIKKRNSIQNLNRTGEAIAHANLIQEYEKEHQKLYEREIKNDNYLQWPAVDSKNLSNYCRQYLHYSLDKRTIANVTGVKTERKLHYVKENAGTTSTVAVVLCKIMYESHPLAHYMTRAPEPNCVHSLKCSGNQTEFICTITNKYCEFECPDFKWKRNEIFNTHHLTGQPIAKDKYLVEYELEHQEMINKERENGKCIDWPHAMIRHNLESYCNQYIKECTPRRNLKDVSWSYKTERIQYEKLSSIEDVQATVVTCVAIHRSKLHYYMTRAPETNCVYGLLQKDNKKSAPFVIVYKHCGFGELNDQQIISQGNDLSEKNVLPKIEIKEELVETLETLPLFSSD